MTVLSIERQLARTDSATFTKRVTVLRAFPRVTALGQERVQRLLDAWCGTPVALACDVERVLAIPTKLGLSLEFSVRLPHRIIPAAYVYFPMNDLLGFLIRSGFHDFTSQQEMLQALGTNQWRADRWQVYPLPSSAPSISQIEIQSACFVVRGQELHLHGPAICQVRRYPDGRVRLTLAGFPWSSALSDHAVRGYLILQVDQRRVCLRDAALESCVHPLTSSLCDLNLLVSNEGEGPYVTEALTLRSPEGRLRLVRGRHTSKVDVRDGTITVGLVQPLSVLSTIAGGGASWEMAFSRTSDPLFMDRRVVQAILVRIDDPGWKTAVSAEFRIDLFHR